MSRRWPRLNGRRIASLLGWSALALVGAGLAWIVVTSLLARSQLQQMRAELPQLRQALTASRFADAQRIAHRIEERADSARSLTSGPAWWVAANLPVAGEPLQTSRVIAAESDRLARAVVPSVLQLAHGLGSGHLVEHGTVDTTALRKLSPQLAAAARSARLASAHVAGAQPSWLSPVAQARAEFGAELAKLSAELTGTDRTVRVLLPMLGESGPRRYFIGFLNEAESRGVGGIPGAFAIVTADHGRITFTHFGSDDELKNVRARVSLGAQFEARYRQDDPQGVIANSDISPQFGYAARIWAGMWQAKTGQPVDGALALDPTALGYLLQATGPADLGAGEQITAQNVVALTQQGQYAKYPANTPAGNAERKRYLTTVAKAVSARITSAGDPTQLARAISRAAAERRLLVWSSSAAVQQELDVADWSGRIQPMHGARAGFAVVNAAGSKLDYYLDRTLTWRRSSCGASSEVVASLRLHNDAPTSGLPPYVTIRADGRSGVQTGDNRLLVSFYAPAGARISQVRVDGAAVNFGVQAEAGSVVTTVDLELPRQSSRTITVTANGAGLADSVAILDQPLARPMLVRPAAGRCT